MCEDDESLKEMLKMKCSTMVHTVLLALLSALTIFSTSVAHFEYKLEKYTKKKKNL